jgi:hypothetical protein
VRIAAVATASSTAIRAGRARVGLCTPTG